MIFNKADFIASYGISSQLPESDRPELSFSGRSNVGKSSLINKLCSRKNLARVSSTPGKTATIATTVYQLWRTNDEAGALRWVMVDIVISAVVLLAVNLLEKKQKAGGRR